MKKIFLNFFYLTLLYCNLLLAMEPSWMEPEDSSSDYSQIPLEEQHERESDDINYPLHYFTRQEKEKEVAYFLELADVNDQDARGRTPLHIAAIRGNQKLVELLLHARAQADAHDAGGATPLDYALALGSAGVAQSLLKNKANLLVQNHNGWTPLHTASLFGAHTILSSALHNLHGTFGPRAYPQKYTALQWAQAITQQWLKKKRYWRELTVLESHNGLPSMDDKMKPRLLAIRRKKRQDEFTCGAALCKLLQQHAASSLVHPQGHTLQEWSEITAQDLMAKSPLFKVKPDVYWGKLYEWTEALRPLLAKADLPQSLKDDSLKVLRWLRLYERGFKMAWLTGGQRPVPLMHEASLKRLARYYESLSGWRIPEKKVAPKAHEQRVQWLQEVIQDMGLDHIFGALDSKTTPPELNAWYKKIDRAARSELTQEYLVIPSFNFQDKALRPFISLLRSIVNHQLVAGILILPAKKEKHMEEWLEMVKEKGADTLLNETVQSSKEFIVRLHDVAAFDGDSDRQWIAHVAALTCLGAVYLSRGEQAPSILNLLTLIPARGASLNHPFFVLDAEFSASCTPQPTREILAGISGTFEMHDAREFDRSGCLNEEEKLLAFCEREDIAQWFELVVKRVKENRRYLKKLQKRFVRYAKSKMDEDKLCGLLTAGIPFKPTASLTDILMALVAGMNDAGDDAQEKVYTVQEWARRLAKNVGQTDLEADHLIWYTLLCQGALLDCDGEQKPLHEWSAIATENLGKDMEKITTMILQLTEQYSYEAFDGRTPFDVEVALAHYSSDMLDNAHIPDDWVNSDEQDLAVDELTKYEQLMKKYREKAKQNLYATDGKVVQDFAAYLKEQELDLEYLAHGLTVYRPE